VQLFDLPSFGVRQSHTHPDRACSAIGSAFVESSFASQGDVMKLVPLATTGRRTTQLGFGCAFPPSVTSQQAATYLDAAYDAGIRHFDVAPSYSEGAAERYLGAFLKRHDGDITVTTKYGLLPPAARPRHVQIARTVLRPVLRALRRVPMVATGLSKTASAMNVSSKAAFSEAQARRSLEYSLKQLGLDKVDLFLLHEPNAADLADERLLQFLNESVAAKRIGSFGTGGDSNRVMSLYETRRAYCNVMQFDWTAFSPDVDLGNSFRVHYWVFSRKLHELHRTLLERADLRKRWSEHVGMELGDVQKLAALMLKAALVRYPNSIVLFTSSNPVNILGNVAVAEDVDLAESAIRFSELARDERREIRLV
jgi:D-threo-aldose 1-dehydrogenase